MPQPPQLSASLPSAISQPLARTPSQSAYPTSHTTKPQTPAVHWGAALAKEHALPHAPQWPLSLSGVVSQPSAARPLQSA